LTNETKRKQLIALKLRESLEMIWPRKRMEETSLSDGQGRARYLRKKWMDYVQDDGKVMYLNKVHDRME
jgi:hypothetical protein